MPTFRQKSAIKTFKSRILSKFKSVKQETDLVLTCLTTCLAQYEKQISEVLKADDEEFFQLYQKLNQDLESFQHKIIVLKASLDICSEDDSDVESEENFQDSLLELGATAKSIEPQQYSFVSQQSSQSIIKTNVSKDINRSSSSVSSSNKQNSLFHPTNILKDNLDLIPVTNLEIDAKYSCRNCHSSERKSMQSNEEENSHPIGNYCFAEKPYASNYEKEVCSTAFSIEKAESVNSVSLSSCYRSLSSNVSDFDQTQITGAVSNNNVCFENSQSSVYSGEKKEVSKASLSTCNLPLLPSKPLPLSTKIFVTLTCITNPSDFWVQLENTHNCVKFPICEHINKIHPSEVKENFLYLAPFKTASYYYRVQALNQGSKGEDKVKMFYVDHGSTHEVLLKDIRPLPWIAYDIPVQAYHCYLFGTLPTDDEWSIKAISRFKEFQNYCIEAIVKTERSNKYGVQLFARASAELSEDFSSDIGLILQIEELAVDAEEYCAIDETSFEDPQAVTINSNNCDGIELSSKNENFYINENKISCDSGVSVSSAYKSSYLSQENNFNIFPETCTKFVSNMLEQNVTSVNRENLRSEVKCDVFANNAQVQTDLISFESIEQVESCSTKLEPFCGIKCDMNMLDSGKLRKEFTLNLKIPSPVVTFVKKNTMLVMVSFIHSPSDFYVNLAMESSEKFDELREQMAAIYESTPVSSNGISIDNIFENMFCASRYEDEFWYRAKVLQVHRKSKKVTVQFVDYGNKATVNSYDLRPLTPHFASYPAFAIQCCLTGIAPVKQKLSDIALYVWNEYAIKEFKNLVTFERPLTAEVYDNIQYKDSAPLQILLWDTTSSEDVLINSLMIDKGLADIDSNILLEYSEKGEREQDLNEIEILNRWDPMSEQYNDIENSYGVDFEDIQVVTTGYSAKDGDYTCKYFSLRGFCPRADCPYLHVEVTESGITRDQEEVYSFDTMPLLPETEQQILVEVLIVKSPGNFYVVLPFGNKTVDNIDHYILNGGSFEDIIDTEIRALHSAMSEHYSSVPFDENTTVALACGNIVAAVSKLDNQWHRGRIIDVVDISKPAKVFFVDYGNEELVDRKLIRKILPQYLHTPFQAIQCSLSDVEPKDFDKGMPWSKSAIDVFENLVSGSLLLAEISYRCGNVLHVTLKRTMKNDHRNISEILVMEEHAQYVSKSAFQKKETKYVPG